MPPEVLEALGYLFGRAATCVTDDQRSEALSEFLTFAWPRVTEDVRDQLRHVLIGHGFDHLIPTRAVAQA